MITIRPHRVGPNLDGDQGQDEILLTEPTLSGDDKTWRIGYRTRQAGAVFCQIKRISPAVHAEVLRALAIYDAETFGADTVEQQEISEASELSEMPPKKISDEQTKIITPSTFTE